MLLSILKYNSLLLFCSRDIIKNDKNIQYVRVTAVRVGERIRQLRKEKGLTQGDLAKKLGVSQAMITQYENHQREPKKFETIKKISAALDVSPEDILGKDLVNTMRDEERTEKAADLFVDWLRSMGVVMGHARYEDTDGTDKIAIIADLDGVPLDIEPKIKDVMGLTVEHFKVIAKHMGVSVWRS
jgi:transcriptional regulator with XRE-family HTH domain